MRIILTLFFIASYFISFAQFGFGGTKAINKLKNTELLVVLGYDNAYNQAIKAAVEKHWNFTEYRFISGPEYNQYCGDKRYSFLMKFTIRDWSFVDEQYDDVGIVLGGNCRTGPYEMVSFANMIVMNGSYYNAECVRAIQMMQNYLAVGEQEYLPKDNFRQTVDLYKSGHLEMKDRTLVLQEEDMLYDFVKLSKVKAAYTHPVRFGGQSEVDKATLNQTDDFLYTKLIFDPYGYKYRCVIRAKDSKILYAIETQNREVILMGKRTLREFNDLENQKNHKSFVLGF
ncbi:MAG: hypothetical protein AAFV80_10875 [Bacteroidota bacterium]